MMPAAHAVSRQRRLSGSRALIAAIEAIADRPDRDDRGRAPVAPQLAAQVSDVDVDDICTGVVVVAPNGAQDQLPGEDPPAIAHQVDEELEFGRRESNEVAVASDLPGEQVEIDP